MATKFQMGRAIAWFPRWLTLGLMLCAAWVERGVAQDSTPPQLVSVVPASGATGVARDAAIQFTFDEPMKPQAAFFWVPLTIVSNQVHYVWSADAKTVSCSYPGGWPKGQTVKWTLFPTIPAFPPFFAGIAGFEDTAGNPLDGSDDLTGTFGVVDTGGGTVGPVTVTTNSCGVVTTNQPKNSFFVQVAGQYAQNSPGPAVPLVGTSGEEMPFTFSAVAGFQGGGSATDVKLGLPGGGQITVSNLFGNYFFFESANTLAALQSRYPGGSYRFLLGGATALPGQIDVNLSSRTLPIIHVSNYAAAQAVNAAQGFTLTWDPLGGLASEPLTVTIQPEGGFESTFESPDFGCPGALNCTSTAFTIPANKLSPGTKYRVTLSVAKAVSNTEINATTVAGSILLSSTELGLQTTGGAGPVVPFKVENIDVLGSGLNVFRVQPAVPQRTYVLQFRATLGDATPWTQVSSATASTATLNLSHTGVGSSGFYRIVGQ